MKVSRLSHSHSDSSTNTPITPQAVLCLSAILAAATADVGFHAHPHVAHHAVHAPVLHTPVSAAVAPVNYGANKPVNGYGHGQVSHQSVSKPYQGEHRSTTQSKAFGAHAAVVADGKSGTILIVLPE